MDPRSFNPTSASDADTRAMQEFLAVRRFYPRVLGIDGDFGAGSTRAFNAFRAASDPLADLVMVAHTQIGVQEDPIGSNDGPFVDLYQDDNGGDHGESWCADFVCECLRWLLNNKPNAPKFPAAKTRAAWGFGPYADAIHGARVIRPGDAGFSQPQRNDIVEYTFSHVGIVVDFTDGVLHAIEGNTNSDGSANGYEVIQHPRYARNIKALIRLPFAA